MLEFLLREALVDGDGKSEWTLDEIGGDFNPSEGFMVKLSTDSNGKEKNITLCFDVDSLVGKVRPQGGFMLKKEKLEELASFYRKLRSEEIL